MKMFRELTVKPHLHRLFEATVDFLVGAVPVPPRVQMSHSCAQSRGDLVPHVTVARKDPVVHGVDLQQEVFVELPEQHLELRGVGRKSGDDVQNFFAKVHVNQT